MRCLLRDIVAFLKRVLEENQVTTSALRPIAERRVGVHDVCVGAPVTMTFYAAVTPLFRSNDPSPSALPAEAGESLHKALERVSACHSARNAERVSRMLHVLARENRLSFPMPGSGHTLGRFHAFTEIAATDLSLGRLAEGHADAHAILHETGRAPVSQDLYGVWAAEPPHARVTARRHGNGWILEGRKSFASGARILQRALVTAKAEDGDRLFDVDLADPGIHPMLGTWPAVGMEASDSLEVTFSGVRVSDAQAIGEPGFYLQRAGFWHGAVGVAACWLGGAVGCRRMLEHRFAHVLPDDHQAAHLGFILATCAAMNAVLNEAAREIDADPEDRKGGGRLRALIARQVVESGCQKVLARTGRASGTGPLVFDEAHARRAADLPVYLRQHHAERDLAELGRLSLSKSEGKKP